MAGLSCLGFLLLSLVLPPPLHHHRYIYRGNSSSATYLPRPCTKLHLGVPASSFEDKDRTSAPAPGGLRTESCNGGEEGKALASLIFVLSHTVVSLALCRRLPWGLPSLTVQIGLEKGDLNLNRIEHCDGLVLHRQIASDYRQKENHENPLSEISGHTDAGHRGCRW